MRGVTSLVAHALAVCLCHSCCGEGGLGNGADEV